MENFGLYEDLSLFSGDLLVGMSPLADELPGVEQNGGSQESTKFQPSVDLFSDAPIKPSKPDPAQDDWMDKKIDLINLLSSPSIQITIQQETPSSGVTEACPEFIDVSSILSTVTEPKCEELQSGISEEAISRESLLMNMTDYLSSDLGDCGQNSYADISFSSLSEDIGDFTTDGLASLLSEEEFNALSAPVLSPVSPQDVESILSSGPSSPESTASINDAVVPQMTTLEESFLVMKDETPVIQEEAKPEKSFSGPIRAVRANRMKKYQPYEDLDEDFEPRKSSMKSSRGQKTSDRKERKKKQNKDAALRYRLKKKQEQSNVFDECDQLEKTNVELKDKVDSMTREIQYLKDLLLEVYKAKGIQPKGLLCK